jgi:hypothetical protein
MFNVAWLSPGLVRVVVGDTLLLSLLVVSGALVGGRLRPQVVSQAAASLVVGLGVLTASGGAFLLVVSVFSLRLPILLLAAAAAAVTAAAFRARGATVSELRPALMQVVWSAPVFAGLSFLVRAQDTRVIFTDVVAFMASAATLARGRSDLLLAEATTFYSFPPGVKVTHALAFMYDPAGLTGLAAGAGGVRPLGLALLVAVAVLMGSAVRQLTGDLPRWQSRALAVAAPAVLLSVERVVFIAHLNGSHAPVAAALLLLALLLVTAQDQTVSVPPVLVSPVALRWVAALLVVTVVLHRWEGLLLVPLLLLPAYRLGVDRRLLAGLWQTVGATVAAWSFAAMLPFLGAEAVVRWAGDPMRSLATMIVVGLVIYVAGTLSRSLPERLLGVAPALGAAGLWLGVAAFALLDSTGFARSVSATGRNVFPLDGPAVGGWRWSGIAFAALAVLLVAGRVFDRRPTVGMFSYPALMFFPAMLIAAFVREGGYRVGFPDSLNRSWLHVLPLLLVATTALTTGKHARAAGDTGEERPR